MRNSYTYKRSVSQADRDDGGHDPSHRRTSRTPQTVPVTPTGTLPRRPWIPRQRVARPATAAELTADNRLACKVEFRRKPPSRTRLAVLHFDTYPGTR